MTATSKGFLLKQLLKWSFLVAMGLLAVCVFRAIFYFPKPILPESCSILSESNEAKDQTSKNPTDDIVLNPETRPGIIERFSQSIRFQTITQSANNYNGSELIKFISFIKTSESLYVCD